MNANTIKLIKYCLVFLVIVGMGIAIGLFWNQNDSLKKQIKNFESQIEQLNIRHRTDSLIFAKQFDSLNKISIYQDSIIEIKMNNIQIIKAKYDAERKRIRNFDADSTLNYFKSQSEISNDW